MGEPQRRKLAVILHADVVGSTALVRRDETLAHERMQGAFRRLAEAAACCARIGDQLVLPSWWRQCSGSIPASR